MQPEWLLTVDEDQELRCSWSDIQRQASPLSLDCNIFFLYCCLFLLVIFSSPPLIPVMLSQFPFFFCEPLVFLIFTESFKCGIKLLNSGILLGMCMTSSVYCKECLWGSSDVIGIAVQRRNVLVFVKKIKMAHHWWRWAAKVPSGAASPWLASPVGRGAVPCRRGWELNASSGRGLLT